ncbi:MAG: nucleotidyltransferase [Clostridiales bacterium]|jgi:NDP-sugar pyrophosphorylase family protein|nr:nucleotidyltransferase [Clostridiales bacterium]
MNTTLVVLAAGLSSRFGGENGGKIVENVGHSGEVICDFSVYDAICAGFNKIVYVIKKDKETEFVDKVSSKIRDAQVELVYQELEDLPPGFSVCDKRNKPWGTSHALWAARHKVNEPFMVISADDFYGRGIFREMFNFLTNEAKTPGLCTFAMPGHRLGETVSEHGSVSRAICDVDAAGFVTDIREIREIKKRNGDIGYCFNEEFKILPGDAIVNMLAFAFTPAIFDEIEKGFAEFFEKFGNDPEAEYYLNSVVKNLIQKGKATLKMLPVDSADRWVGITYQNDLEPARRFVRGLIDNGTYPVKLF